MAEMTKKKTLCYLLSFIMFVSLWYFTIKSRQYGERLLKAHMKNLRRIFPSQIEESWNAIESVLRPVVIKKSWYPAVLLIVAPPGNKNSARYLGICLGKSCKSLVNRETTGQCLPLFGEDYSFAASGPMLFEHLFEELKKEKVVFLEDIQTVSPNATMALAMLLSGDFVSNQNIVFILSMSIEKWESSDVNLGPILLARKYLRKEWSPLMEENDMEEVMKWITANAIKVEKERRFSE